MSSVNWEMKTSLLVLATEAEKANSCGTKKVLANLWVALRDLVVAVSSVF